MPFVELITEAEFYDIVDAAYNPASEYNEAYEEEHSEHHVLMKAALFEFGGGIKYGPHSFERFDAMEDCWTTSRYVAANLTSEAFIRPELTTFLAETVGNFQFDYLMHIIGSESDLPHMSDFDLLVTKNWIKAYLRDERDLRKIHKS